MFAWMKVLRMSAKRRAAIRALFSLHRESLTYLLKAMRTEPAILGMSTPHGASVLRNRDGSITYSKWPEPDQVFPA